MKRFHGSLPLIVLALAAAATARAGDGGPHGHPGPGGFHMQRCLSSLDLPADQHAAIQSTLQEGHATLAADGEALKALHRKMDADIAAGADKAVLGQDALDQNAAHAKLKSDMQATHDQVMAQLSAEQQQAFAACTAAIKAAHAHPALPPAQ